MAIINNAAAGSQINLLCMIYRVVLRNNGKLSMEEISNLCRPENLPDTRTGGARFGNNLKFWMKESHQLWRENGELKLELSRISKSENPEAIATVTNEALFAPKIDDIFGVDDKHDTEPLFRSLGCLLASGSFLFNSNQAINIPNLDKFFREALPNLKPPNDSEKGLISKYGHFLGFLTITQGGDYSVDPTRVVKSVLEEIFGNVDTMDAERFFGKLAELIPLLDGGKYRQEVENRMPGGSKDDFANHRISKSLSLSIERLRLAGILDFSSKSDDVSSYTLQLPNQEPRMSTVKYLRDEVSR